MYLSEYAKIDLALAPAAALNGVGTSQYFPAGKYRRFLFVILIGVMAAAATAAIQVMQATSAAGAGAKAVTNNAATITANTNVAAATITCDAVAATNAVVVNGLIYTAVANGTDPATIVGQRKFIVGTGGTADADTATALAVILNSSTLGLPGVTASANAAVVTLVATEPGEAVITVTGTAVRFIVATLKAVGYVECDPSYLDMANGFNHLAVQVTTSGSMYVSAALLSGNGRGNPSQNVAAAKADVV